MLKPSSILKKPCFAIMAGSYDIRCDKFGISNKGKIPWNIHDDMDTFRRITCKTKNKSKFNMVIMGRKTWESIPRSQRPLKNRINVVLSRYLSKMHDYKKINGREVYFMNSIPDTFLFANKNKKVEGVFVIGGSTIFNVFIKNKIPQSVYITKVYTFFECDNFIENMDNYSDYYELDEKYPRYISGVKNENKVQFLYNKYNLINQNSK